MNKINPVISTNSVVIKKHGWKYFKDNYLNLVYMIPVIVGIVCFTIIPMVTAFVYSLCEMDLLDPTWVLGSPSLNYYKTAFTSGWKEMSHAYFVTFRYAIVVGGISFVGSYILALILNQKLKGMFTFRILYYLPCLIPGLISSLLWNGLTKETGYFNQVLLAIGMKPYTFYTQNNTVFQTMLLLSGWGFSGNMIMWLAQFKNIPTELYEEAELSGAGYFKKLFHITIPMSSSMVFYLIIMSIIGSLQSFGFYANYVASERRFSNFKFVGILIYDTAYTNYNISYACALSWILFGVIALLTLLVFKTGGSWVYYAEDN